MQAIPYGIHAYAQVEASPKFIESRSHMGVTICVYMSSLQNHKSCQKLLDIISCDGFV
jgi:hypothetical protein